MKTTRKIIFLLFAITFANAAVGAENPLSISVLKVEKSGDSSTYVLFSVENSSDQRFETTQWSCVFLNLGKPVHEEKSIIRNVPPRSRAVDRQIQSYGGPFDKIECRIMASRPSTYPC